MPNMANRAWCVLPYILEVYEQNCPQIVSTSCLSLLCYPIDVLLCDYNVRLADNFLEVEI
jgi:hypothetical protein